jgi:hypothetical protein
MSTVWLNLALAQDMVSMDGEEKGPARRRAWSEGGESSSSKANVGAAPRNRTQSRNGSMGEGKNQKKPMTFSFASQDNHRDRCVAHSEFSTAVSFSPAR